MPDESELQAIVERRRKLRSDLLIAVYAKTNGESEAFARVQIASLAEENGWDADEALQAAAFLHESGHLKRMAMGDLWGITVYGIEAVERALVPDEDPAVPMTSIEIRQVEAFARDLDVAVERGDVQAQDPADLEELRQLILTLQTQLNGRGRKRIVRSVLHVIGQLLVGMGGNFATQLAQRIPTLL